MNFEQIKSLIPYKFKSEHELVKSLKELSENFTVRRDRINKYIECERLISAYCLFYMPTNSYKFSFLMNKLPPALVSSIGTLPFVDFGSGPGTYSLAYSEYFKNGTVKLVEKSSLMLSTARKLLDKASVDYSTYSSYSKLNADEHTLLFGNSYNELPEDMAHSLLRSTTAENIIFIEPGTKQSFQQINEAKKILLAREYNVIYPCRGLGAGCPIANTDDWCHQYVDVKLDYDIGRLSQMANLDRKRMPCVFHVFSKQQYDTSGQVVFQGLGQTKHSLRYKMCDENKELCIKEIPISKLKKKAVKELKFKYVAGAIESR